MIFYFSPTKTLKRNLDHSTTPLLFKSETTKLIKELKNLSEEELKTFYNASDKIVHKQFEAIQNQEKFGASGFVYQGSSFKNLDLESSNLKYLKDRLFIGSALYGLTTIDTLINNHRLDFTKNLNNINLVEYWKPKVERYFKKKKEILVDLSSAEYGQLIENLNPIKITFLDNNQIKSTYSKIARGLFLRECSIQEVESIEQLKKIKVLDYKFDKSKSTTQNLVFSR